MEEHKEHISKKSVPKKTGTASGINWEEKAEEYLNGWKRAKADYLNFKKETEKSRDEMVQFANAMFISELLPIIDNFTTALADAEVKTEKEENGWLIGFGHIVKQFEELLSKRGIKKIESVGKAFNPEVHEAIEKQKVKDVKEGTVIKELHTGYTLHGKVLRPSKVIVAE